MKRYKFIIRGNSYEAHIINHENNLIDIEINGTPYQVELEKELIKTKTPRLVRAKMPADNNATPLTGSSISTVQAPLPGLIIKISVKEGDTVKVGDTLLVMEAMKMENNILAEKAGVVKTIKTSEGATVMQNDVLIELS